MKKILFCALIAVFIVANSVFAASPHHPNRWRYGYVPIPLTSFQKVPVILGSGDLQDTSTKLEETSYEGEVSEKEAYIGREGGKQAIMIGPTDKPLTAEFNVPDNYWKDPQIILLAKSTAAIGEYIEWSIKNSTSSTLDTTASTETDIVTNSPSSGSSTEELTFVPSESDGDGSIDINDRISFTFNKKFDGTGELFIYDAYFKYQKKSDN